LAGPAAWQPAADRAGLVRQGEEVGVPSFQATLGTDIAGLLELTLYGLKGAAAYADHALALGYEDAALYAMFHEALDFLATACDGDARKALNSLEIGALTTPSGHITKAIAEESIQKKSVVYDGDEDEHYDTISAFIKSMRGSDPDAALYWLAKMVVAGEDPRFIARRITILAAEDIGLADPQALVLAVAAHHAVEFIGWPEGELPLAEATVYCATAPKSNASAKGIWSAKADVEQGRTLSVPEHLKDTHYKGSERLGHGKGYKYAHDFEGHIVEQEHLPEHRKYYEPSDQGFEVKVRERMEKWKQLLNKRGDRP